MKNDSVQTRSIEWPTFWLWCACVIALVSSLFLPLWLGVLVLIPSLALHASITHEVLHGHPFPSRRLSEALVCINPGLLVPYGRFKETHLAHHMDARLTDPYDDPESNYMDPAVWSALADWQKRVLRFNNTILGRMAIGPALGQWAFMAADLRQIAHGNRRILRQWLLHFAGCAAVLWGVLLSPMSVWVYLLAAYASASVLKIRTFLEHQAHCHAAGRTVIIEDRGLLAFLFLNNNLHVLHHMRPRLAWYRLPELYKSEGEQFRRRNVGYVYKSYWQILRAHFLKAKDPVPHPHWPKG